ncbi:Protein SOP4 [Cyberlindnera fabianii]|uniref:Protein SOP4 n=1 Tax=Cyberlindnera fabianii TaxID=36022 RepID=A0A1V2L8M5_CYBFA|nr:Protein SOP4 [Cyberlindnera fabianii]
MQLSFVLLLCLSVLQTVLGADFVGELDLGRALTAHDVGRTDIHILEVISTGTHQPVKKRAHLKPDGTFKFKDLAPGTYIISASSIDYNLVPYKARVDVTPDDEIKAYYIPPGQKWADSDKLNLTLPMKVYPQSKAPLKEYIKRRSPGLLESGPIATIINNPLYLAGVIIMITVALLPKIMEFMDPEGIAEIKNNAKLEKRQTQSASSIEVTKKLEKVGSTVSKESSPAQEQTPVSASATSSQTTKKTKKRKN